MGARGRTVVSKKQKETRHVNPRQIPASLNMKDLYEHHLPESLPEKGRNIPKVNEDEVPICEALVKKYGDDYHKMFMDHKINVHQWGEGLVKKKVEAWKLGRQRSEHAEILSGHGIDLRKAVFGVAKRKNQFSH